MKNRFQIRVGGISFLDGKILLVTHRKNGKEYWVVPGGRTEWGETARDAVIREFREELNLKIKVIDFLFYTESLPPSYPHHTLNLFFLVQPLNRKIVIEKHTIVGRSGTFGRQDIRKIVLFPRINHIIHSHFNLWQRRTKQSWS